MAVNEPQTCEYSEASFWKTMLRVIRRVAYRTLETALLLYYTLNSKETPAWARAKIIGALSYFILPTDVVPDVLPGIGYSDDAAVLAVAVASVAAHITPAIRARAKSTLGLLFGSIEDASMLKPI